MIWRSYISCIYEGKISRILICVFWRLWELSVWIKNTRRDSGTYDKLSKKTLWCWGNNSDFGMQYSFCLVTEKITNRNIPRETHSLSDYSWSGESDRSRSKKSNSFCNTTNSEFANIPWENVNIRWNCGDWWSSASMKSGARNWGTSSCSEMSYRARFSKYICTLHSGMMGLCFRWLGSSR